MMHTTLSSKGQVIIPKAMRDNQHWGAGTVFLITDSPEGLLLRAQPLFAPTQHQAVAGSLRSAMGTSATESDSERLKTLRKRAREQDDATKSVAIKTVFAS
jgi:AbrB family looped-hinge helix DNA binding protein